MGEQFSPDGQWWWVGEKWVPASQAPREARQPGEPSEPSEPGLDQPGEAASSEPETAPAETNWFSRAGKRIQQAAAAESARHDEWQGRIAAAKSEQKAKTRIPLHAYPLQDKNQLLLGTWIHCHF